MDQCFTVAAPTKELLQQGINEGLKGRKFIRAHSCFLPPDYKSTDKFMEIVYYKETNPRESAITWDSAKAEFVGITQDMINQWQEKFPLIDVNEHLKGITAWGYVNEREMKTCNCNLRIKRCLNSANKKARKKANASM